MRRLRTIGVGFFTAWCLSGISQQQDNCFFLDFESKQAEIPGYVTAEKPGGMHTVFVEVYPRDTLKPVSGFITGNAVATWVGNIGTDNTFTSYTDLLSPALIRYPGGSWSDIFFWNACYDSDIPGLPDSVINGTNGIKEKFWPQFGKNCSGNWRMNVENYYSLRNEVGTQGLITINYGYARYGRSEDPVAQAAKLAADWVRYDNGRTRYWEIGNETGGPWEAGWQIDTSKNKDGQTEIVSGELYGRHFLVFADSMRKAAREIHAEIYIGAQILHYDGSGSWNSVDHEWNEGVFREIGDSADFYVVHNYFGSSSGTARFLLDEGSTVPGEMMDFMQEDIAAREAASRPIALTEWNINASGAKRISSINGMQGVLVFNELIQHGYEMSARWLLVNYNDDGMFYKGDDVSIPPFSPRPDFFYLYYLNRFLGDHMVSSLSDNSSVAVYAYIFESGEIGVVVVNKGTSDEVVQLLPLDYGCGARYYLYSLQGEVLGEEDPEFPSGVAINGQQPTEGYWGPISNLEDIKAFGYEVGSKIVFSSPGRSVQYVLIEPGDNILSGIITNSVPEFQFYPNPASGHVALILPEGTERVEILNINGNVVFTTATPHDSLTLSLEPDLTPGIYFVRIYLGESFAIKKMIIH
jgi:hypothetical protein